MVVALVLAVLAQSKPLPPPSREIAVLVSRRIGVGEVRGQALARKVSDYLRAQGFEKVVDPAQSVKALLVLGVKDSADCAGKRECVSGLGRFLRAWGVVAVDLADVNDTMAMHFEVILSDSGEQLTVHDLALNTKKAEVEMVSQLGPVAAALRAALDALHDPAARPPDDAPVALQPAAQQAVPEVQQSPPLAKAHVGALVTTATAVVGGALVVLFVAQASTAQRQLDTARVDRPNGQVGYNLTQTQAQALASRTNDNYSAALGVGIGTAALAVVSAILWAQK